MNYKLPIVIVTYNRPNSLKRLLLSVQNASYPKNDIELLISIDYSGSNDCYSIAENFEWKYGSKKLIVHKKNLGLRKHILTCGDIALKNDGVIILEDDLLVAKDYYDYALQALKYYSNDTNIAGIALYSYHYNEIAGMPFQALNDGYDNYFMQVPCSWGQVWSSTQWESFKTFYNTNPSIEKTDNLPPSVMRWPETSWKKYFYKYMISNNLYFVYPQISHTTNFGDTGIHYFKSTQNVQVVISSSQTKEYNFINLNSSFNKYDAFFELLPSCLVKLGFDFTEPITIDTYLTKPIESIKTKYVLTTTNQINDFVRSYDNSLKPVINNIIYNINGKGLYVIEKTKYINKHHQENNLELLRKQHSLPYNMGYYNGLEEVKNSKTFKLGKRIASLIDYRKWVKI